MRVLGTRAFGVSVRVRPGAMEVITMPATLVDLKIPSHNALFLALFPPLDYSPSVKKIDVTPLLF